MGTLGQPKRRARQKPSVWHVGLFYLKPAPPVGSNFNQAEHPGRFRLPVHLDDGPVPEALQVWPEAQLGAVLAFGLCRTASPNHRTQGEGPLSVTCLHDSYHSPPVTGPASSCQVPGITPVVVVPAVTCRLESTVGL